MGFPSDYKLYGTKTSKMLQIGNAVCPPVMKSIAERILEYENGFGSTNETRSPFFCGSGLKCTKKIGVKEIISQTKCKSACYMYGIYKTELSN